VNLLDAPHRPAGDGSAVASPADILHAARSRQDATEGAYAGAVTPREAWTLASSGVATIVDVRTAAEVRYVGRVPGALHIEWRGKDAPQVEVFLKELAEQVDPAQVVLFLCRSAVRSHHAAAAVAREGFNHAFNVLEGFEGQRNHAQQRGFLDGWRRHELPWIQD
jgi:rhodanese-related sulfurtransferase